MYFVYFSQKMLEKNLISEVSRYVDKPKKYSFIPNYPCEYRWSLEYDVYIACLFSD